MASSFDISISNKGNVKTANKNTRVPSTRRHTACKDMATGSKPNIQEDFPNLCEEVFHRYGNILNFGFYFYAHFTGLIWEPPNGHLKWFKLRALLRSVMRHYTGFFTYQTIVWSHDSQHSFVVMFNLTPLWDTLLWRAVHLTRCLLRCKSIELRGESLKNLLVIILYSVTVFFRKEQHYQAQIAIGQSPSVTRSSCHGDS